MKAPLKAGYLEKRGGQLRNVSAMALAVLIYHVFRGAEIEEVGFEDAQETLDTFYRKANRFTLIDPALVESALWSCNLMDERGQFWHPRGRTFDQFLKEVLGDKDGFNKVYNLIEKKV